jgi:TolB-like protein
MSFVGELKRRNVVRVGIAYAVIGWLLAQVAEFAFENFGAPAWVLKSFVVILLLGLPPALVLAWAFELTPEGVKREKDVERADSITTQTGRKIDRLIIAVLILAVGFLILDKFTGDGPDTVSIADAELQSIAVLPFNNMSDDSDHFADGLTEELLNLLAQNRDLKVAGRTSSFAFKGRNEDLRGIGETLGVATVLEGSVRRSGNRLRVTAQLINVDDGFHLWSDTYDRDMADIFDIQDEVAAAITRALQLHLTPASNRPTEDVDAYELYLEALSLSGIEDVDDMARAVNLLNRATALDPGFAKAYELEAFFHWMRAGWTIDASEGQKLVHETATRALAIDPSLPGARSLARTSNQENWSWIDELDALEELLESDRSVRALDSYAYDLMAAGYFGESEVIRREILDLDPLSGNAWWRLSESLFAIGREQEAFDAGKEGWRLGNEAARFALMAAYLRRGDDDAAAQYVDPEFWAVEDPRAAIRAVRDPETGEQALEQWIRNMQARARTPDEFSSPYWLFLSFGKLDRFVEALATMSPKDPRSWGNDEALEVLALAAKDSGYTAHPGYIKRARRTGKTELWDRRGPPDRCSTATGEWICD